MYASIHIYSGRTSLPASVWGAQATPVAYSTLIMISWYALTNSSNETVAKKYALSKIVDN